MLRHAVRHLIRALALIVILVGVSAGVFWAWERQIFNAPGPHQDQVFVIINPGDGHASIRWTLKRAGVIDELYAYDAARIWLGRNFLPKAGEYSIPAGASLAETMQIIDAGVSYQRRITVVEGLRSSQILEVIAAAPHLEGEIDIAVDEGSILPETYFFTHGTSRLALLERMQEKHALLLIEAWQNRDKDIPIKTREEAVILASIVEKESRDPAERRLVAGVFMNRLNRGMRLQSDPTVLYGIDDNPERTITKSDLKRKTPWNTYTIKGLPKTAICNPGEDAIEATLNPAKTKYLYFVSDGKGGLLFAKTLDEHNRNVRQFRKIQRAAKAQ